VGVRVNKALFVEEKIWERQFLVWCLSEGAGCTERRGDGDELQQRVGPLFCVNQQKRGREGKNGSVRVVLWGLHKGKGRERCPSRLTFCTPREGEGAKGVIKKGRALRFSPCNGISLEVGGGETGGSLSRV